MMSPVLPVLKHRPPFFPKSRLTSYCVKRGAASACDMEGGMRKGLTFLAFQATPLLALAAFKG
jgi:hypothetical protein